MSTIDRLRERIRNGGAGKSPPPRELHYEPLDAEGAPLPAPAGLPEFDGAAPVDSPFGKAVAIDHVFDADSWHGRLRVDQAAVQAADVALLSRGQAIDGGAAWPALFLDLETTGLSGGAGTVAFLVGCGWFEAGAFRTRQFLLPAFSRERALLHVVTEMAEQVGAIVTYNGRTFDVPVMETRWAFHRVSSPWEELPHVDMLHLARRLWRSRLDAMADAGCRLVTLERDLFGVVRAGDVPGWEIPARYFAYIRSGDASLLQPVLHHNRLDLLSLAGLTARAARLLREGPDAAADALEAATLGRELVRRGDPARAERAFMLAIDDAGDESVARADALHGLARLLRSQRRYRDAVPVWRDLVSARGACTSARAEAHEALAIQSEHRDRDLDSARRWARGGRPGEPLARRLARIERKMDRDRAIPRLPLEPAGRQLRVTSYE
jgi:uncharacterized protein YprB with RNaseH-like and TPR domain